MKSIKESVDRETKEELYDYVGAAVENALDELESGALDAFAIEDYLPSYSAEYCSDEWSPKSEQQKDRAIEVLTKIYMKELLANA